MKHTTIKIRKIGESQIRKILVPADLLATQIKNTVRAARLAGMSEPSHTPAAQYRRIGF